MTLGKQIEVGEQAVEHADHLGWLQSFRERGEVDHVGKQDRCRVDLVGDRRRVGLELVGDGARQDVQQQVLGLVLLQAQRGERLRALCREQGQEEEDDRPADGYVEGDHRALEPPRKGRRPAQDLADEPRGEEDSDEGHEPANSRPRPIEDERPECAEDAPQTDAAGLEEAAHERHRDRGCQQDVEKLHPQEPLRVAGAREDHQGRGRHGKVHVGDHAGRRPEGEKERSPDQRYRQDQDAQENQERLAQTALVVIARIGPDRRRTIKQALNKSTDRVHGGQPTARRF